MSVNDTIAAMLVKFRASDSMGDGTSQPAGMGDREAKTNVMLDTGEVNLLVACFNHSESPHQRSSSWMSLIRGQSGTKVPADFSGRFETIRFQSLLCWNGRRYRLRDFAHVNLHCLSDIPTAWASSKLSRIPLLTQL